MFIDWFINSLNKKIWYNFRVYQGHAQQAFHVVITFLIYVKYAIWNVLYEYDISIDRRNNAYRKIIREILFTPVRENPCPDLLMSDPNTYSPCDRSQVVSTSLRSQVLLSWGQFKFKIQSCVCVSVRVRGCSDHRYVYVSQWWPLEHAQPIRVATKILRRFWWRAADTGTMIL